MNLNGKYRTKESSALETGLDNQIIIINSKPGFVNRKITLLYKLVSTVVEGLLPILEDNKLLHFILYISVGNSLNCVHLNAQDAAI